MSFFCKVPILAALLAVLAFNACAVQAAETVGVAFVHGTGKEVDSYNEYWQPPIVESVRQGLSDPRNLTVINCDFDQDMWAPGAAGCLAEQLSAFIKTRQITRLVVITHSNGGNVMRWILSNPTSDARYPAIIEATYKVTALAPSSAGTPLADAVSNGNTFTGALGWLLGYNSNAVKMQQIGQMASYNALLLYGTAGRPALPRPFQVIVGTDVDTGLFDPDSACGGLLLNQALEISQLWLDPCSDGFLNCSSQAAAGTVWFRDIQRTRGAEALSHNQSRRGCFGLGTLLRNDLPN